MIRIGLDIGSTTVKLVAIDDSNKVLYSRYKRHNAEAKKVILSFLQELLPVCEEENISLRVAGSVGMGFSEQYSFPFVQEVVAAAKAIQANYISAKSMIDIGGEDAKVVFFKNGEATDLRMNGNCAGGTGAFIDQMAIILGADVEELNQLALNATRIYPLASRCGVFCKTDIQNLIAKNVSREDIAASIFHAVAVQTVVTLAHGCDIESPVLFCGGPLTFIPALRKAFMDYLALNETDVLLPEKGALLPAMGAALTEIDTPKVEKLPDIIKRLKEGVPATRNSATLLPPIFENEDSCLLWQARIARYKVKRNKWKPGVQEAFIGIDSGSTTTKIVVLNEKAELLYSFYKNNGGNPIQTVREGLSILKEECENRGTILRIKGSCSTGYGEDLMKAAFRLHSGIIETIAHYMAAHHLDEEVSFILDIGGQDMKAIFVNHGVIDRIEINEACSSGCGSFIETFAKSLGYTVADFSQKACHSAAPCDLGTRCTVFMNSKVKQVLREGATVDDIAAGLAYSIVKNCLYKVLKLKDVSSLGKHIVVQGGTMRNDAIVRAIELLTDAEVSRCDCPELMGAFGCALYAIEHPSAPISLSDMLAQATYTARAHHCKGCENQCLIQSYRFENGQRYYSGNRCEKVFSNGTASDHTGENAYRFKEELLFSRQTKVPHPKLVIGIPRVLNMFEEYPFWHTLFTACGIEVRLSQASDFTAYEKNARMVMSDNICFPAKLVHSHIENLQAQKVDRIFMPFVIFEEHHKKEQNSYNCPIVTGYSAVVKSVQPSDIPLDSPTISFKDKDLLLKQCLEYLSALGVDKKLITDAFHKAEIEKKHFLNELVDYNRRILQRAKARNEVSILLAGRPYHTDPLIQHKVSDMLAEMGVHVLTEDVAREEDVTIDDVHFLSQWAYPNRIMKAAKWCALQDNLVQFVQMTSFGCGPDAFVTDEVRDLLMRHGKAMTLLKLDDINNIGSMRLRVLSLIESLKLADGKNTDKPTAFHTTAAYERNYRNRKVLVPYFTSFISPLIPSILRMAGYDAENLPLSDEGSCEWGLKYANNEVCYPATLIVGDIIKAFKSGAYLPSRSVVAITQTGGQCRASNYLPLIKRALTDAGYSDVPVVSLTLGGEIDNNQPGLKVNWLKMLPVALRAVLYTDCISKFYYASVVREKERGAARKLTDLYLKTACSLIENGRSKDLFSYLALATKEFNQICKSGERPQIGVVGEIYLKFNSFAQKNIVDWLIEQKIEVVPPMLTDFFMQSFVNRKVKVESYLNRSNVLDFMMRGIYKMVRQQIRKVNETASGFRYFLPFDDIFHEASGAENIITLNAQFGEGWLLPAEVVSYARQGVNHVISLQPFGCIANHIVSKGVEKRIKDLYPDMNLLSLDFDSGVSDVNIKNRLLLFVDKLSKI